jgi:lipoyl(octanoyl) transferase
MNKQVEYHNLGEIGYEKAHTLQKEIFQGVIDQKLQNRNAATAQATKNYILFCEHPHVYTLGKSGDRNHLLISDQKLEALQATFSPISRGGDITYHGPGQLVGYPILDLENFFTDIHKYLRLLEEAVILTCADYGVDAGRIDGLTGVWIDYEKQENPRKICAFGVKASRWVTMHGLALNVNTDLSYFNHIVPCGIKDKAVTSLEKEVGHRLEMEGVQEKLLGHLQKLFTFEIVKTEKERLILSGKERYE